MPSASDLIVAATASARSPSYGGASYAPEPELRDALEALPVAIYTTDADGRITFFNQAAAALAGRLPELGSDQWCVSWRMYWPDGTPLPHDQCPMAIALKEGRPVRGVGAVLERPDGTRVPFMPYPTPLRDHAGRLIGAINMLVDISDRQEAEAVQARLIADLNIANKTLEQRVEARTRQLTDMFTQLRDSERRFRLLVEGVIDYALFMLDTDGIITNWNSGAERIKGYKAHEIVGRHFSTFYTAEDRAAGVPRRALATAAREGKFEAEGWRVRQDGGRFWASVVIDAIHDETGALVGFAKITRDVTERRRAQDALTESEQMARGIIATALDGFIQMDETGTVLEWNAQAEAMFGWSRGEAIGRELAELIIPADQRAAHRQGLTRFLGTGDAPLLGKRVQLVAQRRDGRPITVEVSITVLRRRDGRVFNGFLRDLTDRIAAESQLRQAQKMEAIGQLTGGVAHDFNNLLAAIVPSLEMARERIEDASARRHLETAAQAAQRGAKLTHQLLAFARKQDLALQPVAVNRLVSGLCEMLPRTLGPTIAVETALEDQAWPAWTDPSQLELALLNLAINGRDAMEQGGRLTIGTANLAAGDPRLPASLDPGDYVMIAVTDTGPGMTDEVRARAFEPFFSTKQVGRGTGLGLSMVYGLVRQSGGGVTIESAPGQGTTLQLYFARAREAAHAAESPGELDPLEAGPPSRVLVVDDDDAVRSATADLLRGLGHEAVEADSGQTALDLLARDRRFDLLIVDLAMPHMHGAVFAVRAGALLPAVPTLFVTGFTDMHWVGGLSKGHLLKKPFRRADLAEKLRAMLPTPSPLRGEGRGEGAA